MALSTPEVLWAAGNSGATHTSDPLIVAPGDFLVLQGMCEEDGASGFDMALSDSAGLTWDPVGADTIGAPQGGDYLGLHQTFVAKVPPEYDDEDLTISYQNLNGAYGIGFGLIRITGEHATSPIGATVFDEPAGDLRTGPYTTDLDSTPEASGSIVLEFGSGTPTGNGSMIAGTGRTELYNVLTGDAFYVQAQYRDGDADPAIAWDDVGYPDTNNTWWAQPTFRGIEILPAAGGGPTPIEGATAGTLADLTAAATGTLQIKGATAATLGALTLAATGAVQIKGAVGATLGALSAVTNGELDIEGATAGLLADLTAAATGKIQIKGASAATLADVTASAAGVLPIKGAVGATLGALSAVTNGELDIEGATAGLLADLTSSATGKLAATGALAKTLDDLTLVAAARGASIQGATAATLDALTAVATGVLRIKGSVGATLGALSAVTNGELDIDGATAGLLADLTSTAAGKVQIKGALAKTLADLTASSTGFAAVIEGILAVTLEDLTCHAVGGIPVEPPAQTGGSSGGWGRKPRRQKGRFNLDYTPDPKIEPPPPITANLAALLEDMTCSATGVLKAKVALAVQLDDMRARAQAKIRWPLPDAEEELLLLAILDFEKRRSA